MPLQTEGRILAACNTEHEMAAARGDNDAWTKICSATMRRQGRQTPACAPMRRWPSACVHERSTT